LIPEQYLGANMMEILRKDLKPKKDESLYLFTRCGIMNLSQSVAGEYAKARDEDGFLYLYYTEISSFG
jgi:hypothetical protein